MFPAAAKYSGQPDLPVLGYNRGTDLYGRRTAEPDSAIRSDVPDFLCDPEYVPVQKSIRDNIMMGNPEATEEEMMQAAKDAVCHDFIMRLPKGYDTVIDKETKLSGGEKQRITLARAILKNAPVVILDEATAYIDADNEDLLQKALAKLSEGKPYL